MDNFTEKFIDFNIKKIMLAIFFRGFAFLLPVLFLFYLDNSLTKEQLFLFQGLYYILYLILQTPFGYLSEYLSRRNVFTSSLIIHATSYLSFGLIGGYIGVLTGTLLQAIAKALYDSSASAYIYDYLKSLNKEERMVKTWGTVNSCLSLGTTISIILGTYLYTRIPVKNLLLINFFIVFVGGILLLTLPNIKSARENKKIPTNIYTNLRRLLKLTLGKKQLRYYIPYAGLLNAFSIFFAMSFQILMKYALFPVVLFGTISFINHGSRALSGFFANKVYTALKLKKLLLATFILTILSFLGIFGFLHINNTIIRLCLIIFICFSICIQVIFSIVHLSRLHKFIPSTYRSLSSSLNAFIVAFATSILFLSTKLIINSIKTDIFYLIYFLIFTIFATIFIVKIQKENLYKE